MSNLLKESIADAKAVRETALANAKTFLEENFATEMKQMFAEKLREDLEQSDEPTDPTAVPVVSQPDAPSADSTVAPAVAPAVDPAVEPTPDVVSEDDVDITSAELDEILAELEGDLGSSEEVDSDGTGAIEVDGTEDVTTPPTSTPVAEEVIDEEISLEELLAELESDETAPYKQHATPATSVPDMGEVPTMPDGVTAEEMAEALVTINEENESLKTELQEHIKTIKYLRSVLEETNLLNAKLLYTNKLFKGKSLTEQQKLKIINTFDLTRNIREVKLAYTVLAESPNSGASVVKKNRNTTVQHITEGLASKQISSTKPDSTIVEPQANEMALRFKQLAGIKKKS